MYTMTQTDDPWSKGPLGNQNIKKLKKFRNAFLQAGLTDLDEIWHYGRS